jgi:hypothetical protein
VLLEEVGTVRLTDPDRPETSGLTGCDRTFKLAGVVEEIFSCFERHAADSPYGLAQVLYGDWCDPIDMFGTAEVGNAGTRGQGRGGHVRLSAHVFNALVETIDLFEAPRVLSLLSGAGVRPGLERLKAFAGRLRRNIVRTAWEAGSMPGFLDVIHEFKADGTRPDYSKGETGYTLGSYQGRDFDGIKRRELATQAFCLDMLLTKRPYLSAVPDGEDMIRKLLKTVDTLFFSPRLGLVMFTRPVANNKTAVAMAGRMGVLPPGCAENGEYHHCQVFMHRFRLGLPGQENIVWKQFKPMMSAMRDETLAGPFETPCTSYGSDPDDPHFGKGMYFGLSGSVDWIVEIFQKIAGVSLALHHGEKPALSISPCLPASLGGQLRFQRSIHLATGPGKYRKIPFTLDVSREGKGKALSGSLVRINGKPAERAEVMDLSGMDRINIEIINQYGKKI